MENQNIKEKIQKLASKSPSKWLNEAKKRVENEAWLDLSSEIALKVLRILRERDLTQVKLAEIMNVSPQQVSKILKGSENLTIETISKLQLALGVKLIEIVAIDYDADSEPIQKSSKLEGSWKSCYAGAGEYKFELAA